MQISLRSHLIAGTAAVVGASAIALTPVVAQHEMLPNIQLPTASSAVALAGFDSPVTELINTLNLFPSLLFSNANGGFPTSKVGLIPQIIYDALPVVRQLGYNGSDYLLSTLNALVITGQTLSEGVWNFPQAVIDSVKAGSLTPLITAITDTVNTIGNTLLQAGNYVLQGVVARGEALVNTVTSSIGTLVHYVVGQVTSLVNSAVYVGKSIIGATSIEGAWNAAVDGLLGPGSFGTLKPSIPGALVNLTLGHGQLEDPSSPPSSTNLPVPSVRTVVSGLVYEVKGDLQTPDPATPVPVPPPAAAKKVASSTAAVKKVAPSVAATGGGGNSGGSSSKGSGSNGGGSDRGSSHASAH